MHPLDNPIWCALTTRQAHLGEHAPPASRFHPDVSLLGGFERTDFAALARLLAVDERVGVFLDADPAPTAGLEPVATAPLLQMVYEGDALPAEPSPSPALVLLTAADAPDMIALAELTKPGPFNRRTGELGDFVGIRAEGRLVAMAGQRLRVPGHIEVSGICTHPDHAGRGYAAALTVWQIRRILAAGERPFLHVRGDNARAIALYQRLGFATRQHRRYVVLRRT